MPRKVLIVDDIATNRIVLNVKLSTAGYEVVQATNIAEGLIAARRDRPDLVLATARPDKISPQRFLEAFTSDIQLATLPVIMLMECNNFTSRLSLLKAGAADVMCQPAKVAPLLARFRSILRNHDSQEETLLAERMSQTLGFAEAPAGFTKPTRTAIITPNSTRSKAWLAGLASAPNNEAFACTEADILNERTALNPDVIVVGLSAQTPEEGLCLLADLRAHPQSRHAGLIAVIDEPIEALYCNALDRGADEVLPHGFCAEELALRIAPLAARKSRNDHRRAHMHEGLRAAVTDPLTGLYNRRFAHPKLARLLADCACKGQSCAVMAIDVDHFKRVNDALGHTAGDAALVALAGVLKDNMRPDDLVARIGGEEFLVILPDTSHAHAQRAATRLCSIIGAHAFRLGTHIPAQHLTVSIGVAVQEPEAKAAASSDMAERLSSALLERADAALYRSKHHGRNRVTMSARSAA
jgi:two-component system, cell cycle response regulator